jgi:hypothetical protein
VPPSSGSPSVADDDDSDFEVLTERKGPGPSPAQATKRPSASVDTFNSLFRRVCCRFARAASHGEVSKACRMLHDSCTAAIRAQGGTKKPKVDDIPAGEWPKELGRTIVACYATTSGRDLIAPGDPVTLSFSSTQVCVLDGRGA